MPGHKSLRWARQRAAKAKGEEEEVVVGGGDEERVYDSRSPTITMCRWFAKTQEWPSRGERMASGREFPRCDLPELQ